MEATKRLRENPTSSFENEEHSGQTPTQLDINEVTYSPVSVNTKSPNGDLALDSESSSPDRDDTENLLKRNRSSKRA